MTSASAPENDVDVDDDDVDDDERATKRQKLENVLSAKDFVMDSNAGRDFAQGHSSDPPEANRKMPSKCSVPLQRVRADDLVGVRLVEDYATTDGKRDHKSGESEFRKIWRRRREGRTRKLKRLEHDLLMKEKREGMGHDIRAKRN